jgi:hypothetical protein
MSVESNLYDTLRNYSSLSALVSTRIYPMVAAEGSALPLVVYAKVEVEPFNTLDNTVALTRNRFSVQAWALTRDDAETVIDRCRDALAASYVPIEARDAQFNEEVGLHGATIEFDIWA